jgi:hypothetical protein
MTIYTEGWTAHLVEVAWLGKICARDSNQRRAELLKSRVHTLSISRVSADPEIDIFRETRFCVLNHRVSADDHEPDFRSVEDLQQFDPV